MSFFLFADDTSILNSNKDIDELVTNSKNAMNGILGWFTANKLLINFNKIFSMIIHPNKFCEQPEIITKDGVLKPTAETKFLGYILDEKLDRRMHIAAMDKKLFSAIYALRTIKNEVSFNVANTVYFSYFQSTFSHGIEFWANSVDNLFNLFNKNELSVLSWE
ncbi:hypothetical protein JTB14_019691 [Gonioctena quinquepunctata]|nr:hypothetical protein JTB14_019691 [Gonioctena quinquepunctata]